MKSLEKNNHQNEIPHVVIIGGGFGGLSAAKVLGHKRVKVTVIDRTNYHLFQPLLYQVAMAGLSPANIAVPIRAVLSRYKNTEVILANVTKIDCGSKTVFLDDDGKIHYDYLLLSAGATHSYFGHNEWEKAAPGLKTIDDATEVRRRVLLAFEHAERHPEQAEEALTFVVVGGGPTGVELAGALAELAYVTLAKDFRHIHPEQAKIILVEAGPRILSAFPEDLSQKAMESLKRLGVHVKISTMVTEINPHSVTAGNEKISTRTVLWAAGVKASPLAASLGATLDKAGRVLVAPDLSVPECENVFVVGDLASLLRENGQPVPGVAPAAMQEGRCAARNILRKIAGQQTEAFHYVDKGNLATIGRASAVAELGRLHLSGFIAWFMWVVIHIFFLIGFRTRLVVMIEWAWAYFTYKRGARLITKEQSR